MNITENKNLFIWKIVYINVNSNKLFQLRWSCFVFCSNLFNNNNNYFLCSFSTSLSCCVIYFLNINTVCKSVCPSSHPFICEFLSIYTLFSNLFIFAKYSNTHMIKTWFSFYVLLTCSSALHSWSHLTWDFK